MLDGANAVGAESRQQFPDATLSLVLAALALIVTVGVLRRRSKRALVAIALALTAIPGATMVLVRRADAPLHRPATAQLVRATLDDLQHRMPWPQTAVQVTREDDDVLYPLVRYALPTRAVFPPPTMWLDARGGLLGPRCSGDQRLICGVGP